jgi:hypothetical protein
MNLAEVVPVVLGGGRHDLFDSIRKKTLFVASTADNVLEAQHQFEESCAKTPCNLSCEPAPLNREVAFWIVPNASLVHFRCSLTDE